MESLDELLTRMKEVFRTTDKDGSGNISREEYRDLLANSGYKHTEREIEMSFKAMDEDHDNTISIEEFLQAMTGIPMVDHRRALWRAAFVEWDSDGSGEIDRDEVQKVYQSVLGRELSDVEVEKLFTRMDKDGSGKIAWEEFAQYFASL